MNIGTNVIVASYLFDDNEMLLQSRHVTEELKSHAPVDCKFAFHCDVVKF